MLIDNASETSFRTSNTAQAAYLISEGFGMPEIDLSPGGIFSYTFKKSAKLEKAATDFDTAQAKGNIVLFFNAYQSLLRRIKER